MPENNLDGIKKAIKDQAHKEIAKWSVVGVIGMLSLSLAGWGLYFKKATDNYILTRSESIPKGAVVAFLSSESEPCPGKGWELYKEATGRFIVGAGIDDNGELETRRLEETGGFETVALNEQQMPSHTHRLSTNNGTNIHDGLAGSPNNYGILPKFTDIPSKPGWSPAVLDEILEKTGGNSNGETERHPNIPPYIALYLCKKV